MIPITAVYIFHQISKENPMSTKEDFIKPITSEKVIHDLSEDLRKTQESYYLIFHIILETGMPLKRVLQLKVSDLYRKPKLQYESRHRTTLYSVAISLHLQRELMTFLKGRKSDEIAFTGARSTKGMYVTAFQKALNTSCERLHITPPVNATTLRKTFIRNILVSDGNFVRAAHFTDSSGPAEVLAYLGIDYPEEISIAQASKDLDKALQRNALPKLKKEITSLFEDLERLAQHKDGRTLDETLKAIAAIGALSDVVSSFKAPPPQRVPKRG